MSHEGTLLDDLAALSTDPLKFVLWAFPWGEPGPLEHRQIETWQAEFLASIRDGLPLDEAIRCATVSGNGVGKSALVAWIILWAVCTREDTLGVITANTETQLKTKTWAQLGKWFQLFIANEFFQLDATALFSRDPAHRLTWRADMVPWSERNAVAFQGLHNEGKRLFLLFDEASGIPDIIFDAAEGCLTDADTERLFLIFGNPNKPTGRFRECAPGGKFAHRWKSTRVDSRTVSFTDKAEIDRWVKDYGEDHDFVRVRVLGTFPRVGTMQFIGTELASLACAREVEVHLHDPLIMGVDVARQGDDDSVIYFRKGRDGRTFPPLRLRPATATVPWLMILAGRIADEYAQMHADAVFVDEGGVGAGVVDRLRQLNVPVIGIQFGAKPDRAEFGEERALYANKRAEMWGFMKEWLKGGAIPDDAQLREELTGPEYGYNALNAIQLERKQDMRSRGLASPDAADALALTFAYPVMASALAGLPGVKPIPQLLHEYDPFDLARAA